MGVSLGIAIGAGRVRAMALRGDRVLWAAESSVAESIAAAVAEVIAAGANLPRWPQPRVTVALGPAIAQTRRLTGLPPVGDSGLLARVVAESPGRFFLENGRPLVTTGIRVDEPGTVWAAAVEENVLDEVERACRDAGLRGARFVPGVVCVARAIGTGRADWLDGHALAEIEADGGVLRECVRRRANAAARAHGSEPEITNAIAALETYGAGFADAYGAAALPAAEPLTWAQERDGAAPSAARRHLAFAGIAAMLGLTAALITPGLAALYNLRAAEARLRAIEPEHRRAEVVYRELAAVNAALREAAELSNDRLPALAILAELTRLIPDGSTLVTLRFEAQGGNLIGLAPQAASIIDALDRSAFVVAPELTGPVIREAVGDRDLERVHVRFRFADRGSASP